MMNKKLHKLRKPGLVIVGLLTACSGGDINISADGPIIPSGLPGTIQLQETTFDVTEGAAINIRVARSGGSSGAASVRFATADGTADGGADFTAVSGTLTWANQQSGNKTITIPITDDNAAEPLESFTVTLSNVSGAALGPRSSATVNIMDNDTAALSALGSITGLNSVTVNGIRYDTNATNVYVNGMPATVSDLKLGQLVLIEGEANFSNARGTANLIEYFATAIGPVENIDAASSRLLVMGQTVLINADTVFDPGIDPDTFAGLTLGSTTQISGFLNSDGDVIATRIEPDSTSNGVQLVGTVAGLDLANMLFSVNRLTVDYSNAAVIDLPMGMPANGLLVIVRGSLTDGILIVDEIGSIVSMAATPGERLHLGGIVTRFTSRADFDLNGLPITTNTNTGYVNGVAGDLEINAEITIDGQVTSGGDTILANDVTFGHPSNARTTLPFDFDTFTNISVFGLSDVTVVQGTDYSIEVSAGTNVVNDLQVTQNGNTVSFGLNDARLLNARVTMPALNRIDVGTDALANVTLRDFDQTKMTVNLGGVSVLRGEGLQIGELTATVAGVSLLDFGDVRPIGNAYIDVDGVSQATLNMGVGSTLEGSVRTGQGTGVSRLFYYGTDINVNVTTDSLSRVTRLGETRP